MKTVVPAGHYVVAVSGGVDSMVLLDLLTRQLDLRLTVAHFDHGIRADSSQDRRLVEAVARLYHLPFVYHQGHLGPGASEDQARIARYNFLHKVRLAAGAKAIITAHHQDDMLETAIINILRGTGRRGLSSLKSQDKIIRPLLAHDKKQLQYHADENKLVWREDSSNADEKYLRNYARLKILKKFTKSQRQQLLEHITKAAELNNEIEDLLTTQLHIQPHILKMDRHWFVQLPHNVAKEVLASWLRAQQVSFDRKTLERLVVAAKTYKPHKRADISGPYFMTVSQDYLALGSQDR
ncbi:MAG: tRNA lysidine(34) synthetase TilS [Candidatus Saccharibacteria bacterium]